jgi:hypothetical protein
MRYPQCRPIRAEFASTDYAHEWQITVKADDLHGAMDAVWQCWKAWQEGHEPIGGSCPARMGSRMDYEVKKTKRPAHETSAESDREQRLARLRPNTRAHSSALLEELEAARRREERSLAKAVRAGDTQQVRKHSDYLNALALVLETERGHSSNDEAQAPHRERGQETL